MRRKGMMLMESTLKIIVAVIVILVLMFFLYKIYDSYRKEQELGQAEESLKLIKRGLNEAKEKGASEIILLYPGSSRTMQLQGNYWWITSWPSRTGVIPGRCAENKWEKCLCICRSNFFGGAQGASNKCDDIGVCIETESDTETDDKRVRLVDKLKDRLFDVRISPEPIIMAQHPMKLEVSFSNNKYNIVVYDN